MKSNVRVKSLVPVATKRYRNVCLTASLDFFWTHSHLLVTPFPVSARALTSAFCHCQCHPSSHFCDCTGICVLVFLQFFLAQLSVLDTLRSGPLAA
ncbi:hypothetical protein JB92DRAFT_3149562 [Gautieria morchelliformis]|nr:hypothetical protein JB92DRAFT_3149562 [Gautieria morchelliformis]